MPVVPAVPAAAAPALDDPTGDSASDAPPPHPPTMAKAGSLDDPSVKDADEVARAIGADIENGLTSEEASRRISADGPNKLRSAARRPAWRRFLSHFHDPPVYLLLAAVAIALVAWVIESTHDLATARTAGFTMLVLAHLFNAFNARSDTANAFAHLFTNPWLWGAISLSLLLQVAVVNFEFLNVALCTVPLAFDQWLVCIAVTSVVVWYSELRKLIGRAWGRRSDA